MSVLYRCDRPGCEDEAPGWAGAQHAPPPGWWTVEVVEGSRGPERVVIATVHACSRAHAIAALSRAMGEGER